MTFGIILAYLALLIFLGVFAGRLFQKNSSDFFLASRGIGPFMLLMSIFGTTMTAFALIGSTGKAYESGIGVYGLMASWSGIVHAGIFFLVGAKVWSLGKRHGYLTQISYFRDRYGSDAVALTLFPVAVLFVLVYILTGIVGGGTFIKNITGETFSNADVTTSVTLAADPGEVKIPKPLEGRMTWNPENLTLSVTGSMSVKYRGILKAANPALAKAPATTPPAGGPAPTSDRDEKPALSPIDDLCNRTPTGAVSYEAGMAIVCLVVLFYVFFGGMRATAWANTFQTIVFMVMGVVAFIFILRWLGGAEKATADLLAHPEGSKRMAREGLVGKWQFLTYCFVPLSVGMFPHLFQHWLTARKASNFKLTVVAHPICIMITWIPCILVGMWAAGKFPLATTTPNSVLPRMVDMASGDVLSGLIAAGVLAAVMSSMDSQFLCLSSIFTNDIVARYFQVSDQRKVFYGRAFVVVLVAVCYGIACFSIPSVFDLGVWCFTGFSGLFPVLFASLYWRRTTKAGVIASTIAVVTMWAWFLPEVLGHGAGDDEELLFFAKDGDGILPAAIIVGISTIVLILVSLLTKPPEEKTLRKFFS